MIKSKKDIPEHFFQYFSVNSFDFSDENTSHSRVIDIFKDDIKTLVIFFVKEGENNWNNSLAEIARKYKFSGVYIDEKVDILSTIESVLLGCYQWDIFSTKELFNKDSITFFTDKCQQNNIQDLQPLINILLIKVIALYLVRDLTNLPPNYKTPLKIAEFVSNLKWDNTEVILLQKEDIQKIGMELLLAVSKGSNEPPVVIIFHEKNKEKIDKVFVGKGVTFDAGGLQIKPDIAMFDMKSDMAGAAAVIGATYFFDKAGYPTDSGFLGIIGLVENLLGGSAFKPSDIYTACNGKFVEIGHTDAEGRLVLGDLIAYISKTYSPTSITSIATLTGACIAALGYDYMGIMSKDVEYCLKCQNSINNGNDTAWMLPLDKYMIDSVKSESVQLKNISPEMKAGSSLGGAFLSHFVDDSIAQYLHIDIAGPAFRPKQKGLFPMGATGAGTEAIIELAKMK